MNNNGIQHDDSEIPIETLAETENYTIWAAEEPDGEMTYHLELGPVTAHFFVEEWEEFLEMARMPAGDAEAGLEEAGMIDVELELDWGILFFDQDEWKEFLSLLDKLD